MSDLQFHKIQIRQLRERSDSLSFMHSCAVLSDWLTKCLQYYPDKAAQREVHVTGCSSHYYTLIHMMMSLPYLWVRISSWLLFLRLSLEKLELFGS